jgi:hypothetical protein
MEKYSGEKSQRGTNIKIYPSIFGRNLGLEI